MNINEGNGQQVEEDVEVDTTNDVVLYHMDSSMGQQWVLNDFSKVTQCIFSVSIIRNIVIIIKSI